MKTHQPVTTLKEYCDYTPIHDLVDEASTDSFPASDPPPWTLGRASEAEYHSQSKSLSHTQQLAAEAANQLVDEADEESFPASDPPVWTTGHSEVKKAA